MPQKYFFFLQKHSHIVFRNNIKMLCGIYSMYYTLYIIIIILIIVEQGQVKTKIIIKKKTKTRKCLQTQHKKIFLVIKYLDTYKHFYFRFSFTFCVLFVHIYMYICTFRMGQSQHTNNIQK